MSASAAVTECVTCVGKHTQCEKLLRNCLVGIQEVTTLLSLSLSHTQTHTHTHTHTHTRTHARTHTSQRSKQP